MNESRPPDPRLYWESEVTPKRYYYRLPDEGVTARDGVTFVPPQNAPTPDYLLDAYLASQAGLPTATSQSLAPPQSVPLGTAVLSSAPAVSVTQQPYGTAAPRASAFPPLQTTRPQSRLGNALPPQHIAMDNGRPWPSHARGMAHTRGRGRGNILHGHNAGRSQRFNPVHTNVRAQGQGAHARGSPLTRGSGPAHNTVMLRSTIPPSGLVAPPDIAIAPRGADRHPVFPGTADDGPDDGGDTVEREREWRKGEAMRIQRHVDEEKANPRAPEPLNPAAVGVWSDLIVLTMPQVRNLLRWSDAGCTQSWAMVQHLQQHWGLSPLAFRSAGIGMLLSRQQISRQQFYLATTGRLPVSQKEIRRQLR